MSVKIGMTGSRESISIMAFTSFKEFIKSLQIKEAHHGDCVGADTIFHNLMEEMKVPTIIHPPDISTLRTYCNGTQVLPPKPYLKRNNDIVDATDILVAFPYNEHEIIRSGTWSTIRYAKKINKPVVIFYPDGSIDKFNYTENQCLLQQQPFK